MYLQTRHIIFSLLILSCVGDLIAQNYRRPTATASHRGRFTYIKMNKAKSQTACPVFNESQYPYHGIGIKVGDPFALTYKYYATKNFSIGLDAGKVASGLYSKYYRDNFNQLTSLDTLGPGQEINYLGHIARQDWMAEGKVLYRQDAGKLIKGLHWYIGAGVQWRKTEIQYEYLYVLSYDRGKIQNFNNSYFTMGGVGVFGMEYAYFALPIAAFMEIEWYHDMMEDKGWSKFQGGVGIRIII